MGTGPADAAVVMGIDALDELVRELERRGYRVLGPVLDSDTIRLADLDGAWRLPTGWTLDHAPGSVRLRRRDEHLLFAWVPGADSPKREVFPPADVAVTVRRHDGGWTAEPAVPAVRPLALLGARACELRALDVLDRVRLGGEHPDPRYATRRADTFVVAVDCSEPGGTCFCTSAGGGPRAEQGYDLRLTELADGAAPRLVASAGSDRGGELMDLLVRRGLAVPASLAEIEAGDAVAARAAEHMGRALPDGDLHDLLARTLEHPRWDDVAARCLSCTSCTMVCPTCFCSSFTDETAVGDPEIRRVQRWASCFQLEHSWIHGGSVHASTRSRYRQWLTHKLGTWHDQFGESGCVGCGRCIDWCPVGIDLTEELAALARPPQEVGS